MTESEDAEFAHQMDKGIKKCVIWDRTQDFSQINEEARGELESLFSNGEEFDPMAGMQIRTNMMMFMPYCMTAAFSVLPRGLIRRHPI